MFSPNISVEYNKWFSFKFSGKQPMSATSSYLRSLFNIEKAKIFRTTSDILYLVQIYPFMSETAPK
jgi:hypothetical protein